MSKYALPSEVPGGARFQPHHYLTYQLQPGYRKGLLSHNSDGFRGPEVTKPKPDDVFRIVAVGGSTTYTEFVPDDAKTFTAQLQQLLNRSASGRCVEVVNAGVPGYNSWETLINVQMRVLDLEPDLLIVYHGVNDVHCRLVHPDSYRADNRGRRKPWTEPIEVRLLRFSMLGRVLGHHAGLWSQPGVDAFVRAPTVDPGVRSSSDRIGGNPTAVLNQNPPVYFRRNLVSICALAKAHGCRVLLATWAHTPECGDYAATPHYQLGFAQGNSVVAEVAKTQGALFFDFASVMPTDRRYWRDGRHVNEAGAKMKAELFAHFLEASEVISDKNRPVAAN